MIAFLDWLSSALEKKIRKFPYARWRACAQGVQSSHMSLGPARREYQERLLKISSSAGHPNSALNWTLPKESLLSPNLKRDMKYFTRNMDKTAQAAYEKLGSTSSYDGKITAAKLVLRSKSQQTKQVASYKVSLVSGRSHLWHSGRCFLLRVLPADYSQNYLTQVWQRPPA